MKLLPVSDAERVGREGVVIGIWPRESHCVAVFLGFVLLSYGQVTAAEQLFRWKFKAGESLNYQFKQMTQTETAGAGMTMRVVLDTAMGVTWKIESVSPENVASIVQTLDQFRITMTTDKLDPITYDSTAKAPPLGPARELANGISKLLGLTCKIQMSDRGEIVAVEPTPELKQALEAAGGSARPNAAQNLLTPEGMTAMLKQAAIPLPESAVAEGSKWEATQATASPLGTIVQNRQFIYVGPIDEDGQKLEKITVETTFKLQPPADGTSTKLKEGGQQGTLWFDSAAGRFTRTEMTQRLLTERPYRDSNIRVQSSSTLTMTLSKRS